VGGGLHGNKRRVPIKFREFLGYLSNYLFLKRDLASWNKFTLNNSMLNFKADNLLCERMIII